jgi:FkbM family methyltransferase
MQIFERLSIAVRHSSWLGQADWLWNKVRPHYDQLLALLAHSGLERNINGTDLIRVLSQFRGVSEIYEPEVWTHFMSSVRPGDTIADVGAYIGLYTIALAKRVGASGKIVAFEPTPKTFAALKAQVELNGVSNQVELIQSAVGIQDGSVSFEADKASQACISRVPTHCAQTVQCLRLDTVFADRHLDILKIDVEGYEEDVLKSGVNLLSDNQRSPRIIYIEVHPYAWPAVGTTCGSLLSFLNRCQYQVLSLDGQVVKQINHWGEVIAYKNSA